MTSRHTIRTVKTIPQAIPVAMTKTEEEDDVNEDESKVDLDPVTALESVTPEKKKRISKMNRPEDSIYLNDLSLASCMLVEGCRLTYI